MPQEADKKKEATSSMVVVSEFVGCSPSVSGAIRVRKQFDMLLPILTSTKTSGPEVHVVGSQPACKPANKQQPELLEEIAGGKRNGVILMMSFS